MNDSTFGQPMYHISAAEDEQQLRTQTQRSIKKRTVAADARPRARERIPLPPSSPPTKR